MPYKTRVSYIDADGCQCKQQSNTFNAQTSLTDIHLWISTWFDDTYKLQIQDPDDGEWIDFDQGFFNQQNPYNSQPVINLKILQNSIGPYGNLTTHTPIIHPVCKKVQAPPSVTVNDHNPNIIFTRNVNNEQRDEDLDKVSTIKGDKHISCDTRAPKIKIMWIPSNTTTNRLHIELAVFLVWEMCERGNRTLYYHPYRNLVQDSTDRDFLAIPTTNNMFDEEDDINVKTQGIRFAKTGGNDKDKVLLCRLNNVLSNETNYETSRLACFLTYNGAILWDTIALSTFMLFKKSYHNTISIDSFGRDNQFVETIVALEFKRKKDLNQSDTTVKHASPVKRRRISKKQQQTHPNINQLILAEEWSDLTTTACNSLPTNSMDYFNSSNQHQCTVHNHSPLPSIRPSPPCQRQIDKSSYSQGTLPVVNLTPCASEPYEGQFRYPSFPSVTNNTNRSHFTYCSTLLQQSSNLPPFDEALFSPQTNHHQKEQPTFDFDDL